MLPYAEYTKTIEIREIKFHISFTSECGEKKNIDKHKEVFFDFILFPWLYGSG